MQYTIFNTMTKEASTEYGPSAQVVMQDFAGAAYEVHTQGKDKETGDYLFRVGCILYRVEEVILK